MYSSRYVHTWVGLENAREQDNIGCMEKKAMESIIISNVDRLAEKGVLQTRRNVVAPAPHIYMRMNVNAASSGTFHTPLP